MAASSKQLLWSGKKLDVLPGGCTRAENKSRVVDSPRHHSLKQNEVAKLTALSEYNAVNWPVRYPASATPKFNSMEVTDKKAPNATILILAEQVTDLGPRGYDETNFSLSPRGRTRGRNNVAKTFSGDTSNLAMYTF